MKKLMLIIAIALSAQYAFSQTKPKIVDKAKDTSATAFKVSWNKIFKRNTDGSYSAIIPVQINGEILGTGIPVAPGIKYGGVDIASFAGHDMLVDTVKSVVILRKIL